MRELRSLALLTVMVFISGPAYAMCEEFGPGMIPGPPAPRVTLCYKGKCDDTTADTICGNDHHISMEFANGLEIIKEGEKQPVFTNKLNRKMRQADWTCAVISPTPEKPCALFNAQEPGEDSIDDAQGTSGQYTMKCVVTGLENTGKDYDVYFDKQKKTLYLSRNGKTYYHVTNVAETSTSLIVSGDTVSHGPQFKAYFYPTKMMEYLTSGAPNQQDQCHVSGAATTSSTAEKKVEQFLLDFEKSFSPLPAKSSHDIKFVDLNGDGIPEALVVINDPLYCGSRGCSAFVLDLRGPAAKDIGDFTAFDLQPLSSRTRGWRDISLVGSQSKKPVHFNGQVYS